MKTFKKFNEAETHPAWALSDKAEKTPTGDNHIAAGNAHFFAAQALLKNKDSKEYKDHLAKSKYHYAILGSLKEDEIEEDAPTNNAGGGNVAGIGVGAQGEPGVSPNYQRKRKQLELMNGPAVDPRLFADKIFQRKDAPVSESKEKWSHPLEDTARQHGFQPSGKEYVVGSSPTRQYIHPTSKQKFEISKNGWWRHSVPGRFSPTNYTSLKQKEPSFD